jgi:8-oxo-dGTP pyrophosphatase MutT (NUDIX family)
MDIKLLTSRFVLCPVASPISKLSSLFTPAAVLFLIVEREQQLNLILTRRASHLRHHSGQIALPGGKTEQSDSSSIATALRETHEEIGIPAHKITVLGTLPSRVTISRYCVTPVVALVDDDYQSKIDPNEVEEIFEVPLAFLLNDENHIIEKSLFKGKYREVTFMPWGQYPIWGTTAAIIKDFSKHIRFS